MVLYVLQSYLELIFFVVVVCKIDEFKSRVFSNFFIYIDHSSIVVYSKKGMQS